MSWKNKLYYGDCLTIMQDLPVNYFDLIYLDPPFNSNRTYNAIYTDEVGRPLPDQIEAFCDTWELTEERERAIRTMPILMRESGIDDDMVQFWQLWMHALRNTQPRLLAYLSYMVERLIVMYKLMKPTASLYLHCDPTASHYLKALLDALFGHDHFRNEIVWRRTTAHSDSKRYGANVDNILFYTKGRTWTWNPQYLPYDEEYKKRFKRKDPDGRAWSDYDLTAKGLSGGGYAYEYKGATSLWRVPLETMQRLDAANRLHFTRTGGIRLKRYLDEMKGKPVQALWDDIDAINSQSHERMGYATQKPLALMERIIKTSSNPGDIVLDPFCGCATTLEAAQRLGRRWVGIDIAIHAIKKVAQMRLVDRCALEPGKDFEIEGVPRTLEGAQDLWDRDKYQFQKWAVEQVEGFCTPKRSADGGVDGRIYFELADMPNLQSMVVEVKGGKSVNVQALRALRGILDNEDALMAGLIVMEPLGKTKHRNFEQFMVQAGDLIVNGFPYPRMQMLTVPEILEGKRFSLPNVAGRHELRPRLIPVQPGA